MKTSSESTSETARLSLWQRFWHQPTRAESLALVRILLALSLLTDLLFQHLPNLEYFYGATGVAPAGVNDGYLTRDWRWTILFFHTDNMAVLGSVFAAWVLATVGLLLGWKTRWMSILVWLGTLCFLNRNPNLKNGGDDIMQMLVFMLMFAPAGKVFSLDHWLRQRKDATAALDDHWISPWSLRLIQFQLCLMYTTTGIAKLKGHTWLDGLSVHNALADFTMTRWSIVQFSQPAWLSKLLTWGTLVFELGFIPLVYWKRTRFWILLAGLGFHLGIYITIEVGWFSFYSLSYYPAFLTAAFWNHRHPLDDQTMLFKSDTLK